jgi:hypothetical protein
MSTVGSSHQRARTTSIRRLKLAALLVFCSLASTMTLPRSQIATATSNNHASSLITPAENREPEFNPVRFKRVGIGQRISFGLSVIDEESDDVRVELVQKPASARYNEKTLTVDWTPQKSDGKSAMFAVRITEFDRATNSPRRLFEERGMTCIQCHVRNFDEGDYLNAAVRDPKAGGSFGTTNDIPRLFFVLTPDEERSEFFRPNEEEQVGNLKGVMRDYLKVNVNLDSPLSRNWPHNTRVGRS